VRPGSYGIAPLAADLVLALVTRLCWGDGAGTLSVLMRGDLVPRQATFALSLQRKMRGTIDLRRGGWVRRRTLRRVRWRAIAMTGIEASASSPALPGWFGPRASADDPAVSALIAGVARGAGWADIGGEFNLNVRIDAEPPLVLRVHRPWVRRGRVAGLRRLRERLGRTQVRVARPIRISGGDLFRVADRWAEVEELIDHVQLPAGEESSVRLLEDVFTLRSGQSGSPVRPSPSTTTGHSGSCVTRPASRAAGSDPAASRPCAGCAS
jgi:hypothetical protein